MLFRLLQKLLAKRGWHFKANNIAATLRNMNVVNLSNICYHAAYSGSRILNGLNDLTALELNSKYYLPAALKRKIKQISK